MHIPPKTPEVRVPRLVGLMAVDACRSAEARGVLLASPDRADVRLALVDYVVRQYPPPGVEVPRGAVVTVWFDFGEGEGGGGAGVREPRSPRPPRGGTQRELDEPGGHSYAACAGFGCP
ncbi:MULTISPECIES: PASTA domain-containing protein [unclassified Streptomyces]|uniref:PASTA domain-containing protein n=1 Tax=unclassified Streptomyces TaxID=2593676 RepID=UPI0016618E86|nr:MULTISPECIES: PASTA domain-containing protein [unclassified Streptomyces]MBD0838985.1 PASTA domain-containing protein [Streptomyces sp. TRM68416]